MLHLVAAQLQEDGEDPWRLSVMFSPFPVRDPRFYSLFPEPLAQPCALVFGLDDWAYRQGRLAVPALYREALVLEHPEGHGIPTRTPRGEQVLAQVAQEMSWQCGFVKE